MNIKINKKITGFKVVNKEDLDALSEEKAQEISLEKMHEDLERPEFLIGSTYKIKTPMSEHALYVTINDVILNEGTEHESRRPFEVFINSKNMDHFQWVVALTRVISAVFRKGGDIKFLVEELKSVFDPQGGYFKPGTGKFMPSLVAEIGESIEHHMKLNGTIKEEGLSDGQKQLIADKRAQYDQQTSTQKVTQDFPAEAIMCLKCSTKAVIRMDGCNTCLSCGDSKCG
jgi:hypothetical protein